MSLLGGFGPMEAMDLTPLISQYGSRYLRDEGRAVIRHARTARVEVECDVRGISVGLSRQLSNRVQFPSSTRLLHLND